ncbi:FYB1 protein, partial [Nyctibius bracteatus]|nr:FYB1 protein [Nyctibius bracteatus]
MAKFNTLSNPTEDVCGNSRPFRVPRQPVPTGLQTRKATPENFASQGNAAPPSGPSTVHKAVYSKPPVGKKPSTDDKPEKDLKPQYLKPVAQSFGVQLKKTNKENDGKAGCTQSLTKTSDLAKEEPKPLYPKPSGNKFLNSAPHEKEKNPLGTKSNSNFAPQESEAKPSSSKVTAVKEKLMSATTENEPKLPFSKPPLACRCSLTHNISHKEDTSNKNVFLPKGLSGPRRNIHSFKAAKETDENSNRAAEAAGSHFSNMTLKPSGHWSSSAQGTPKNMEENTEEKGMSAAKNIFLNKIIQEESDSSSKFHKANTALAARRPSGGSQKMKDGDGSSGVPKRKALPALFNLGQCPQKPSRPHSVDLERFRKRIPEHTPKNECLKQKAPSSAAVCPSVPPPHAAMQLPPPPPASHPSLQSSAAPSLPPRNIKPNSETISPDNEENYDGVEFVSQVRFASLLRSSWQCTFRSSRGKENKWDKEEKRRMDQEKKEQKEKEKKEQEIRKKFKVSCLSILMVCQNLYVMDCPKICHEIAVVPRLAQKGSLPHDSWSLHIKFSCYGYIKTTMVEIDYDSLKRKQQPSARAAVKHPESDQEVYDDVGEQDSIS